MTDRPSEVETIKDCSSSIRPMIVINASNLHNGGGIQVATSFLMELSQLDGPLPNIEVLASTEIAENLRRQPIDISRFASFEILDVHGMFRGIAALRKRIARADFVFTIFGPLYLRSKPRMSIVGFAQSWILYPHNDAYRKLSWLSHLRTRLKFAVQKLAFRRGSDFLVVEADHVRRRLVEKSLFNAGQIFVVPNCLNQVFLKPDSWRTVEMPPRSDRLLLGLVTRDYPHKNLDVLPAIRSILSREHGVEMDFVVTLTKDEWDRRSATFRRSVVNVGPLSIDQCPSFYEQIDGVIFPSLLECFSATPLEAMYMRKPLFASDRAFVREFCGDFPWYFDPNSPTDAAKVIAEYANLGPFEDRLKAAHRHVLSLPGARDRAVRYLNLILDQMSLKLKDNMD